MVELAQSGVLRVVPPAALDRHLAEQDRLKAEAAKAAAVPVQPALTNLAAYIRQQFEMMRNHRDNNMSGWTERLLRALRAFNGQYDESKLAEIQKFGGSQVYARITAMKCRGTSSLLRDVYLQSDRPWGLDPNPDPEIPSHILQAMRQLMEAEIGTLTEGGQPPDANAVRDRANQLMAGARQAAKKKAAAQCKIAEDKIDEFLIEGGFYKALAEFLVDVPLFPFACIKGPTVRIVPSVKWVEGRAQSINEPKLFWNRISPFDIWWTPGVADIEDAAIVERQRLTRADLNDLLGLPGYDEEAIRAVLDDYGRGGLSENWDSADSQRADQENRENPQWNRSGLISCLEFNGNIQGRMLLEQGMSPDVITDGMRDYMVQAWIIGQYVIKVQLSPSPRKRHPYFVTSFEKVPGTPVGNALPDILADVQDVCNSTLRSLVNNLSISSGPQVVVNDDRLSSMEDGEDLYPWKRWHVRNDPLGQATQVPVSFFQPQSNAQELLGVYDKFNGIADDLSAIPRYLQGGSAGGAGRTASGLSMLMQNASKILQAVAANIDRDVIDPLLQSLYDMLMLTDDTGLLTGNEQVRVMGVNVAIQRETQRARQLEFLQITANPIDMSIIGPTGRAKVLSTVADGLGMPGAEIVPDEDTLQQQQQAQAQLMQQQAAAAQGDQAPKGGNVTGDQGPRTNIVGGPQ